MKLPANFLISLVGVLSVTRLGLGAPLSEPSAVLARSPEAKMTKDQMCEILENNSLFDGHSCDEFFLTLRDRPKNKRDEFESAPVSEPSALLGRSPEVELTKERMCEMAMNHPWFLGGRTCNELFAPLKDKNKDKRDESEPALIQRAVPDDLKEMVCKTAKRLGRELEGCERIDKRDNSESALVRKTESVFDLEQICEKVKRVGIEYDECEKFDKRNAFASTLVQRAPPTFQLGPEWFCEIGRSHGLEFKDCEEFDKLCEVGKMLGLELKGCKKPDKRNVGDVGAPMPFNALTEEFCERIKKYGWEYKECNKHDKRDEPEVELKPVTIVRPE